MIRHLLKLVWNRKRANALIVAEIFVSFLVIFAVITGAVTYASAWKRPVGFQWKQVWDLSMEFDIDGREKANPELLNGVMRMLAEARSYPEVEAAAISNTPPYAFSTSEGTRTFDGRQVSFIFDDVSDGFEKVMQLQLVRGRFFSRQDDASPHQPIVVDTKTAEAVWGTADPIGQKLEEDEGVFLQVVGVVKEYRKDGEVSSPMNMMFRRIHPEGKYGRLGSHILVRVKPGTPPEFEVQLTERLRKISPEVSFQLRRMEKMRARMLRVRFAPLVLGGIIGTFLVAMVALGLTGVLWQNVTQRTREIGLRRAMGATGSNVHRQVLGEVAVLATIALLIGSVIVLQLPILGVFKLVSASAFTTGFIAALATIYALTILCGLYPSWLASRLQPADALRYE
ncbi:MAG TPA: FtsX-like permease family protein [Thermoanaerobaculia bacterium]|nr:FtsX-like permease family protein [Thermoanaerobaculia bacterium]